MVFPDFPIFYFLAQKLKLTFSLINIFFLAFDFLFFSVTYFSLVDGDQQKKELCQLNTYLIFVSQSKPNCHREKGDVECRVIKGFVSRNHILFIFGIMCYFWCGNNFFGRQRGLMYEKKSSHSCACTHACTLLCFYDDVCWELTKQ